MNAVVSRLELNDIAVRFGKRTLFERFHLSIAPGEIVRVDGENGSGKSTVLNVIMGVIRPQSGNVLLDGMNITVRSVPARARMGIRRLPQLNRLFEMESADRNILAGAPVVCGSRKELLIREAWPHRMPHEWSHEVRAGQLAGELSYGWQRTIGFMQAIISRPRLLLLDEPFAGLAPSKRHWMAEIVESCVREHDASVILIDHEKGHDVHSTRIVQIQPAQQSEPNG